MILIIRKETLEVKKKAVLSVSFGQVCSPVTDKAAALSAPVHAVLQITEAQGTDHLPCERKWRIKIPTVNELKTY